MLPQLKIPTAEELVAALVIKVPPPEVFNEARWPYTYSTDILVQHSEIVPRDVHKRYAMQMLHVSEPIWRLQRLTEIPIPNRMTAARVRKFWALQVGIADHTLATILAEVYCVRWEIDIPEVYRANTPHS